MDKAELAALVQYLTQMSGSPEEQSLLMRSADQGSAMQGTPSAMGQNVAGTYVASSPLEHLSVALQRVMGGQKQKGAEEAYRASITKQTAGRGKYGDALLRAFGRMPEESDLKPDPYGDPMAAPYYIQRP